MRSYILLAVVLFSSLFPVFSSPSPPWPPSSNRCRRPIVRKEWRTLDRHTQKKYLNAVKCILQKPKRTPNSVAPSARSRFDDFVTTHIIQFRYIHWTGSFLPWHRYFTAAYEKMLREECGYDGAQPYWDWTLDVKPRGKFAKSPIFDKTFGFGGNGPFVPLNTSNVPGRSGGGCVQDGPFKDMLVRMGPLQTLNGPPSCLKRDFAPTFADNSLHMGKVRDAMQGKTYIEMFLGMEGESPFLNSGVHGGGHFSIGGDLGQIGDGYASPSDPLFYLHHANIDRLWWSWQKKNLRKRLTDIDGPLIFMDWSNAQAGNTTLSTPLHLGVNAPDPVQVKDLMHIQEGPFCYDYDRLYF